MIRNTIPRFVDSAVQSVLVRMKFERSSTMVNDKNEHQGPHQSLQREGTVAREDVASDGYCFRVIIVNSSGSPIHRFFFRQLGRFMIYLHSTSSQNPTFFTRIRPRTTPLYGVCKSFLRSITLAAQRVQNATTGFTKSLSRQTSRTMLSHSAFRQADL